MANTTYDELYTLFMDITRAEPLNYPQDTLSQYRLIHNGIGMFNQRVRLSVAYDDVLETVDKELKYYEKRIIALYMKYDIVNNNKIYKSTMFDVFTKEVGLKSINAQLKAIEFDLSEIDREIDMLIMNEGIVSEEGY